MLSYFRAVLSLSLWGRRRSIADRLPIAVNNLHDRSVVKSSLQAFINFNMSLLIMRCMCKSRQL